MPAKPPPPRAPARKPSRPAGDGFQGATPPAPAAQARRIFREEREYHPRPPRSAAISRKEGQDWVKVVDVGIASLTLAEGQ